MSPRTELCLLPNETETEEEQEEEVFHTPVLSKNAEVSGSDNASVIDETSTKKKKKERNPRPGESTVDFLLRKDPTGKKLRLHVQFLESRISNREMNAKLIDIESLTQALQWYGQRTHYRGEQPEVSEDEGSRARIVLEAIRETQRQENAHEPNRTL
jgi:hypothetical protein